MYFGIFYAFLFLVLGFYSPSSERLSVSFCDVPELVKSLCGQGYLLNSNHFSIKTTTSNW